MAFFILIISVFVFLVTPTCNISGSSSFSLQPIILTNDNFSHSEGDNDGEDDGDDDGEDVNQETKQEQVEAEVGPFWGIR